MEFPNFFILLFCAIYTYLVIPLTTCTAGGCFPPASSEENYFLRGLQTRAVPAGAFLSD